MEAPATVLQLFRWLAACSSLLGSPAFMRSNTVAHRGHTCCPRGCPGPSNTNAAQPIKEIWVGCSRRANTHIHRVLPLPLSMKNEDIRAHKIQLYLSLLAPPTPSPSSPSAHSLHLPTAELTKSNYTCLITSRTIKTAVGGWGGPV